MNALDAVALVAEAKIREALADGLLDHLPGAGKPLVLEDLSRLPPEGRMAYTILKNSGFVEAGVAVPRPPEEELSHSAPEEGALHRRLRRLNLLLRRVRRRRGADPGDAILCALPDSPYLPRLLQRVPGPSPAKAQSGA
jgi:hypothetical protein